MQKLSEIQADFALLDEWEDRYREGIELGRTLKPLPDELRTDANKVRGCASQVWFASNIKRQDGGGSPQLSFEADSDAHIVRGLIAIVLSVYDNRTPAEILEFDIDSLFEELKLLKHLSPTRGNGLRAMIGRIRDLATSRG